MRERVEELFRLIRRIRYLVNSPEFAQVYAESKDKETFKKHLDDFNINGMRKWIEKQMELESLSYRQLRRIASMNLIPYYSQLNKEELIKAIRRLDANKKDT